jgi:hypothetical protein
VADTQNRHLAQEFSSKQTRTGFNRSRFFLNIFLSSKREHSLLLQLYSPFFEAYSIIKRERERERELREDVLRKNRGVVCDNDYYGNNRELLVSPGSFLKKCDLKNRNSARVHPRVGRDLPLKGCFKLSKIAMPSIQVAANVSQAPTPTDEADVVAAALAGGQAPTASGVQPDSSTGGSGWHSLTWVVVATAFAVGVILAIIIFVALRRRSKKGEDENTQQDDAEQGKAMASVAPPVEADPRENEKPDEGRLPPVPPKRAPPVFDSHPHPESSSADGHVLPSLSRRGTPAGEVSLRLGPCPSRRPFPRST